MTASDDIELTGHWWDPSDVKSRWSGTLRIHPDGSARLMLLDPPESGWNVFASNADYAVLHGISSDGKRATLLRCFTTSSGGPLGGLRHREVYVNAVLLGFHADGPDPAVSGVTGIFRHSRSWHGSSNLKVQYSGTLQNAQMTYGATPPLTLYDLSGVTLRMHAALASLPSAFGDDGSFQIKEELRFDLAVDTPRPLSELDRMLAACRDLLSIACQDYCDAERWLVYQGTDEDAEEASYHSEPIFQGRRASRRFHQMLFCFSDIADDPAPYFTRWLQEADRLKMIRSLYFSAVYGQDFVQGRFLALTQALEAFHRRYRGGKYMPEAEFASIVAPPLYAAIPKGLDSSHVQSLKNRIKYGYEHSLRKRLADLFTEHSLALEVVMPDAHRLLPRIVAQRNTFTHFPEALDASESEGEEFVGFNGILQLLLELCFLKLIGFNDEGLKELVQRAPGRVRLIRRFLQPKGGQSAEAD